MTIPPTVRAAVDTLLAAYATYKKYSHAEARAARTLAKARLLGMPTNELEAQHKHLTKKLQKISDAMTFADPLVWALYKYEAYADEPQSLRTLQDFRVHCSKPGYICTKRFTFVNTALRSQKLPTLQDTDIYPDAAQLSDIFEVLHTLSQDVSFMQAWRAHEYYTRGDRVAKWENA
jgi:hypothetical protein